MARQQWIVPTFRRGGELMDYEIYQAETGHKKKYLVFAPKNAQSVVRCVEIAKKFFKCSVEHLFVQFVWVNDKDLYLEDPRKKGFYKRYAFSYYSTRRKV